MLLEDLLRSHKLKEYKHDYLWIIKCQLFRWSGNNNLNLRALIK